MPQHRPHFDSGQTVAVAVAVAFRQFAEAVATADRALAVAALEVTERLTFETLAGRYVSEADRKAVAKLIAQTVAEIRAKAGPQ
ncbi:MAG: hypothetical protein ACRCVA_35760 [Phreatobacter sp.]